MQWTDCNHDGRDSSIFVTWAFLAAATIAMTAALRPWSKAKNEKQNKSLVGMWKLNEGGWGGAELRGRRRARGVTRRGRWGK